MATRLQEMETRLSWSDRILAIRARIPPFTYQTRKLTKESSQLTSYIFSKAFCLSEITLSKPGEHLKNVKTRWAWMILSTTWRMSKLKAKLPIKLNPPPPPKTKNQALYSTIGAAKMLQLKQKKLDRQQLAVIHG